MIDAPDEPRARLLPPALTQIEAEKARRSLAWFFFHSWRVLDADTLVWGWHIQAMCDHVQALFEGRIPSRNLLINVPPGSSKSRAVSVCALVWWWIDHPEFRGIFSSANPRLVVRDSLYSRQLIQSPWYQESFRPTWQLSGDQNVKTLYQNTAGGFRLAIGSGAKVTGDRGHGLFMDDMLDAQEAESRTAHEAFANFYDLAFANRLNDARTGIRCMIGQRLHENDPAGHVTRKGSWEVLRIRQEYTLERANPKDPKSPLVHPKPTSIGWRDPRTEVGQLMDPVRFTPEVLAEAKTILGSRGWASQHQQEPAPAEGAIVKRASIRWYRTPRDASGEFMTPREIPRALGITRIVQGVDTALSEKQSADNTANCTLGEASARIYVLDLWMNKVDAPAGRSAIIAQHAKWGAHAVLIEGGSSASGKAAAQSIHADTTMPIIEMPVLTDKVVGLNAVAPTIEAGVVYLPEDQPWAQDFVESLCKFPSGMYDDDVDAFRIALSYLLFGGGNTGLLGYMHDQLAKREAAKQAQGSRGNGNGNGTNALPAPEFPMPSTSSAFMPSAGSGAPTPEGPTEKPRGAVQYMGVANTGSSR